jgi:uncharacterized membrane protein
MKGMARKLVAASAAAGIAALALVATTATAGIVGPCSASIAGTSVAGAGTGATAGAILVDKNASVPVVMSAPSALSHVRFTMEFAGFTWTVKDKAVTTPVYRDTLPVKDYAKYGVGLYKVNGVATGPGVSCTGKALVRVKGNPITTVAGGVGLGAAVLGAFGVFAGMGGGGGAAGLGALRVGRSSIAGLLAGLGGLVLLQQYAVLYPTVLVAAVGLALGFGAGAVAPWLGHTLLHGAGKTVGRGRFTPPKAVAH